MSTTSPQLRSRKAVDGASLSSSSSTEHSTSPSPTPSKKRRRKANAIVARPVKSHNRVSLLSTVWSSAAAAIQVLFRIVGITLSPFQGLLFTAVFATVLAYLLLNALSSPLSFLIQQLPRFSSKSLPSLSPIAVITASKGAWNVVSSMYCDQLGGVGCPVSQLPVAQMARIVGDGAQQASTIFESVIGLGDPSSLGLHQTEVWELGMAVRSTSQLEGKEVLGTELMDLGDLVRDVKDRMITINSMGLNAFSFIVYDFSRIEDIISKLHNGDRHYTVETVSQNVDILFQSLSERITKLLDLIESTIPLTQQASNAGGLVTESLSKQYARLNEQRENTPLWRKLKDGRSWEAKQLQRDLDLTDVSVQSLKLARFKLEDARSALVAYRDNAAMFKASMVGWHLADHGLTAEDEIFSLRHIMNEFKGTVSKAKAAGRGRISA